MIPFNKCPVCGGELIEKEVEKILRGGTNTAIVKVQAEVCQHCGERLFSPDIIKKFEEIRKKLKNKQTDEYTLVGHSYMIK